MLAYLTGAPLVPCFIERVGPGRFTTFAWPPIYVDRTLPRDAAIQAGDATVWPTDRSLASGATRSPGITSIATGTRSAISFTAWTDGVPIVTPAW